MRHEAPTSSSRPPTAPKPKISFRGSSPFLPDGFLHQNLFGKPRKRLRFYDLEDFDGGISHKRQRGGGVRLSSTRRSKYSEKKSGRRKREKVSPVASQGCDGEVKAGTNAVQPNFFNLSHGQHHEDSLQPLITRGDVSQPLDKPEEGMDQKIPTLPCPICRHRNDEGSKECEVCSVELLGPQSITDSKRIPMVPAFDEAKTHADFKEPPLWTSKAQEAKTQGKNLVSFLHGNHNDDSKSHASDLKTKKPGKKATTIPSPRCSADSCRAEMDRQLFPLNIQRASSQYQRSQVSVLNRSSSPSRGVNAAVETERMEVVGWKSTHEDYRSHNSNGRRRKKRKRNRERTQRYKKARVDLRAVVQEKTGLDNSTVALIVRYCHLSLSQLYIGVPPRSQETWGKYLGRMAGDITHSLYRSTGQSKQIAANAADEQRRRRALLQAFGLRGALKWTMGYILG
ncbi:hypothetical protein AAMO2058_001063600 [Amorphochlora amoebiformis]